MLFGHGGTTCGAKPGLSTAPSEARHLLFFVHSHKALFKPGYTVVCPQPEQPCTQPVEEHEQGVNETNQAIVSKG